MQPRLPDAQYRLAFLLEHQGHRKEAGECYRRALAGGPNPRLRRLAEARALLIEGQDDEAERKLRRAVGIEPNDVGALTLLGTLLTDAGAFEEAASCFERALAQPGCSPEWFYDLVRCRKITSKDDALLQRLRAAVAEPRRDDDARVKLFLALGKASTTSNTMARRCRPSTPPRTSAPPPPLSRRPLSNGASTRSSSAFL